MSDTKVKVGLIGCGGIAELKHLPSLKANHELCEIVAFCDIIEERAAKAAREYGAGGAKVYTDYRELLKNPDVEAAHVLTPNVSHCRITADAFAAGKHVMCEKPMAANTEDAQQMMDAWKKSGRLFTIGYQNRFRPEAQMLHKVCRAGELGEIYFAKAPAVRRRAVPTWGVFPDKSKQGGGPLIDIGTHALDLTLWMMDNYELQSVSGSVFHKLGRLREATEGNIFGPWDPETYEVEDSAFGFIKMKNGATVILEASWALNVLESREAATTLCGTKAGAEIRSGMSFEKDELYINRGAHGLLLEERIAPGGHVAYFDGASQDPGVIEAKQWLMALRGQGSPLVKPEQAFLVTAALDAIYRSAETGKEIRF
ncbi:MAG: Gfo/Idh/MocA family oxidoreductase [Peptococcaceae bacterium]|nr:Gfo/Idh/MocA family oxidoreductase [Peptococcaceae bacterium]